MVSNSAILAGYDMLVQITQNEINSQFSRMFGQAIQTDIKGNGFGAGGPSWKTQLTSYLRGFISAPQVTLATKENPLSVLLSFSFVAQTVTAVSLGVSDADLQAAFANSPDGINGLLSKTEDVNFIDSNHRSIVMPGQNVKYWLKRQMIKIGSISKPTYKLIPSLSFHEGAPMSMVSLCDLVLTIEVTLGQAATNVDEIKKMVNVGSTPPELLGAIQGNHFDEDAFSLTQLFLTFDTTDFTQWTLSGSTETSGGTVEALIANGSSLQVKSQPLSNWLAGDRAFSPALNVVLQNAFGFGDEGAMRTSPYIVGVNVQNQGSIPSSDQGSSLVPTYIGYSTTRNADPGLSALSYQVNLGMGGPGRVPKDKNGNPIALSTNTITTNDFSGEMLFSSDLIFLPKILAPLMAAITATVPQDAAHPLNWTQYWSESVQTWTAPFNYTFNLASDDSRVAGTGSTSSVTRSYNNTYVISLNPAGRVEVSGNMSVTTTIELKYYIVTGKVADCTWSKNATLNWTSEIAATIDTNNGIVFKQNANIPQPTIGSVSENGDAQNLSDILDAFSSLSNEFFDPFAALVDNLGNQVAKRLYDTVNNLSNDISSSIGARFISPTGNVFLLNSPRFNNEFDLQIDVTYDV